MRNGYRQQRETFVREPYEFQPFECSRAGSLSMSLNEILADPGLSNWLKDAIKTQLTYWTEMVQPEKSG